jgi:hypothetical protein
VQKPLQANEREAFRLKLLKMEYRHPMIESYAAGGSNGCAADSADACLEMAASVLSSYNFH